MVAKFPCAAALLVLAMLPFPAARACTSAVVAPGGAAAAAPLLWKNRDTSDLSNRLVFVHEAPFSYVGLVNRGGAAGHLVYAGLNAAGFAVMNTVAYNLPKPGEDDMDGLEGMIMADALRACRSVDDFEALLRARVGSEFGSQANFGAFDASGGAAVFEAHNGGVERTDVGAQPRSRMVVTNFARGGEEGKGAGYLRFARAEALLAGLGDAPVTAGDLLGFARDTGHELVAHPDAATVAATPASRPLWIATHDCIDKSHTAAAVVVSGRRPGAAWPPATLWIVPGEPVTAVAIPVWVEAGAVPEALWTGSEAPLWAESARIKKLVRPYTESDRSEYLLLSVLDNAEGTGFRPALARAEADIRRETAEFLARERSSAELAAFQTRMAERALSAMRAVR
jgi:hypothetical protein